MDFVKFFTDFLSQNGLAITEVVVLGWFLIFRVWPWWINYSKVRFDAAQAREERRSSQEKDLTAALTALNMSSENQARVLSQIGQEITRSAQYHGEIIKAIERLSSDTNHGFERIENKIDTIQRENS